MHSRKTLNQIYEECCNKGGNPPPIAQEELVSTIEEFVDYPKDESEFESFCERRLWWWRRKNDRGEVEIFKTDGPFALMAPFLERVYRAYHEDAAWFYEFAARYGAEFNWGFGCPFPRCISSQWVLLASLHLARNPTGVATPTCKEKTKVTIQTVVKIDGPDKELKEEFMRQVEEERQRRGIKVRKSVRRVSFAILEALDKKHFLGIPLSNADRSRNAKEGKRYREICDRLGLQYESP